MVQFSPSAIMAARCPFTLQPPGVTDWVRAKCYLRCKTKTTEHGSKPSNKPCKPVQLPSPHWCIMVMSFLPASVSVHTAITVFSHHMSEDGNRKLNSLRKSICYLHNEALKEVGGRYRLKEGQNKVNKRKKDNGKVKKKKRNTCKIKNFLQHSYTQCMWVT